jgi:hypothetical protein
MQCLTANMIAFDVIQYESSSLTTCVLQRKCIILVTVGRNFDAAGLGSTNKEVVICGSYNMPVKINKTYNCTNRRISANFAVRLISQCPEHYFFARYTNANK